MTIYEASAIIAEKTEEDVIFRRASDGVDFLFYEDYIQSDNETIHLSDKDIEIDFNGAITFMHNGEKQVFNVFELKHIAL